jgi:hypothetical protein
MCVVYTEYIPQQSIKSRPIINATKDATSSAKPRERSAGHLVQCQEQTTCATTYITTQRISGGKSRATSQRRVKIADFSTTTVTNLSNNKNN